MHLRLPITPDALNAITRCADKEILNVAIADLDTARFHEGFDGFLVSQLRLELSDGAILTMWADTRHFPVEGVSYGFETFVLDAELTADAQSQPCSASPTDDFHEFAPLAKSIVGSTIRSFEVLVNRDGYYPEMDPAFLADTGGRINTDRVVVEVLTQGVLPTWLGVRALTVVRADAMAATAAGRRST